MDTSGITKVLTDKYDIHGPENGIDYFTSVRLGRRIWKLQFFLAGWPLSHQRSTEPSEIVVVFYHLHSKEYKYSNITWVLY